jgi:hydroxypyruvate reductase
LVKKHMNTACLMTDSLHKSASGERIARIMKAALEAVAPAIVVERCMQRVGNQLVIGEKIYQLNDYKRVFLIGFGKASTAMGETAAEILSTHLSRGVLIAKKEYLGDRLPIPVLEASHPVPDQRSIRSAQSIIQLLSATTEKDLVICLISGGGSALLTAPVSGISLEDIQSLTKVLLGCGATINEINCLRKHLSRVKGGQLTRHAAPAKLVTLILSDVVDDPLDVIASGPTTPDTSTFSDALSILKKYDVIRDVPSSITQHLQRGMAGDVEETPKSSDPIFNNVQNLIIGNNYLSAKAAIQQGLREGFNTLLLTTSLQGEAREAGKFFAAIAKQVAATGNPVQTPACIVAGGETTVTLSGDGLGGRNQELALGAVEYFAGLHNAVLVTLATDGDDGPTDAAGAVVTGETLKRASRLGMHPSTYLSRNASYEFFDQLGDLLMPGMTGTNVNDLTFLIIF